MHRIRWAPGLLTFISLGIGLQTLGCWPLDYAEADGGGGQSGSGGSGGAPVIPGCVPHDVQDAVADSCGVFVNNLATGATPEGTKADPFSIVSDAVAAAANLPKGKKNVYLCAQEFTGTIELPAGVRLYGGLSCPAGESDWRYKDDGSRTTLSSAADTIPLKITGGGDPSALEDVNVVAEPAGLDGGSSIAVVADAARVSFTRCTIVADNAKSPEPRSNPSTPVGAPPGNDGEPACSDSNSARGGAEIQSLCDPASVGGAGGAGNRLSGSPGTDGAPGSAMPNGGVGQTSMATCANGKKGDDGIPGMDGVGAKGPGRINATGYVGDEGVAGLKGGTGKGGGGGGGSRGGTEAAACSSTNGSGAGGGSGGPGGCGGAGGKGGGAGGSSIAIVSLNSELTFTAVILQSANAGVGGAGGREQDGAAGGPGGIGGAKPLSPANTTVTAGCNGGAGGAGGPGGAGGGGSGGHSLGIAYTGTEPSLNNVDVKLGAAGAGVDPIHPAFADGRGAAGQAVPMLKFD